MICSDAGMSQCGTRLKIARSKGWSGAGPNAIYTAVAIREAADRGGYGYRWWKANDIEDGVGYNALPMRALTEHLYDPAFWKALGKARSWQDTGAWLFHWHRFIDHIAFGKDVESFFSNL